MKYLKNIIIAGGLIFFTACTPDDFDTYYSNQEIKTGGEVDDLPDEEKTKTIKTYATGGEVDDLPDED